MSVELTPNVGLRFGWETGDDDWGGGVNFNWMLLDVVNVPFAKSITVTAPPANPENGDRYIIPANATGIWADKVGRLAYFASDQWIYFQPKKGWYQRVFDTRKTYVWNGLTWEYYLDSITPEMMTDINSAIAAGAVAAAAAESTASDRVAVQEDREAVDTARLAVEAGASQIAADKAIVLAARTTAVESANDAAISKQTASESAVLAAQKAQDAAASAGAASSSASTAFTSAGVAAAARDASIAAKTDLFNRYYGSLPSDPLLRPDGTARQAGDEYFNSADGKRKVFNGTAWEWFNGASEVDLAADAGGSLVSWLTGGVKKSIGSWIDDILVGLGQRIRQIDTYADAATYSSTSGRIVYVAGRATKGDGGGGSNWLDTKGTVGRPAANGGTILHTSDGWLTRQFTSGIACEWFGASPSATATENTTAIQTAINLAGDTFQVATISAPGVYLHNGLSIPRFAKLRGSGAGRVYLKNTNGTHSITIDGRLDAAHKHWEVSDLTILHEGNPAGTDALRIYDTSYGKIEGVVFQNIVGKSQHWEAVNYGCYNNRILGCRYTGGLNPQGAIYLKGVGGRGVSSNVWLGGEIIGGAFGVYIDTDGGYGNYFGIGIENGGSAGDPGTALIHCADGPNTFEGYLEVYAFGTDGIRLLPGGQDCTFRPTAFGFNGSGVRLNNTSGHGYNYAPGPGIDYTEMRGVGLRAGYLFAKVGNAVNGNAAVYGQVGDIYLNSNRGAVSNGTTVETDLYTHTVPANALVGNTNGLKISVRGDFAANANTKTIRAYFGGSQIFSTAVPTNGFGWELDLELVVTTFVASPGASTIRAFGTLRDGSNTVKLPVSSVITKDLGAAQDVRVTGQSNAAGGDITKYIAHVQWKF